ncbi:RNA-binding S4 domain-containing protein [Ruegeria sp. 2205SS24-7]|uniref:RNA-binding S4 domain-containing protein n=1 Tax=Ruegeria discodermiae TaxID=3064389 RepID=UPI002740BF89|nr:RNA-binding S4 domain-containing protein [Ruegeria sp. 2205SS24-7]MDP5215790.1 RNA-binding S4 domain-containing protein [Ruegeria sp. 2205SS24-7]
MSEAPIRQRLDKWLWHARFFKTRSLAAKQVAGGKVRVNGTRTEKPAQSVGPGDVLTFAQAREVRVIRIEAIGERRGPAPEAQQLYQDLSEPKDKVAKNPGYEGKGRPTKKERRSLDLSRRQDP